MQTTIFNISGMSCENCVGFVTKALQIVPGVSKANVSLAEKKAVVQHSGANVSAMQAAVEEEGYAAQLASEEASADSATS